MSDSVPVILAIPKGSTDPVRVNLSDYEADQALPVGERAFKADGEAEVDAPGFTAPNAPPPAAAAGHLVMKEGRKFFVVTIDGTKVEGFDADGYSSEAAARAAIDAPAG